MYVYRARVGDSMYVCGASRFRACLEASKPYHLPAGLQVLHCKNGMLGAQMYLQWLLLHFFKATHYKVSNSIVLILVQFPVRGMYLGCMVKVTIIYKAFPDLHCFHSCYHLLEDTGRCCSPCQFGIRSTKLCAPFSG